MHECNENIDENEMIHNGTLNDHKNVCWSCAVWIALFSVFLTISIGIGTFFIHFYWYSKNRVITNINPSTELLILAQWFIKHINGNIKQMSINNQTYYFFNDMINVRDSDSDLLKTGKKSYKNIYHHENICSVNLLYLNVNKADRSFEEKIEANT